LGGYAKHSIALFSGPLPLLLLAANMKVAASSRLGIEPENSTLERFQLPFLGLRQKVPPIPEH
jgi:hypothetical protein